MIQHPGNNVRDKKGQKIISLLGETRECTVENYIVSLEEIPTNGDGFGILSSKMDNSIQQHNQLITSDISNTGNKIQTQSLPTGPFIYDMPKH